MVFTALIVYCSQNCERLRRKTSLLFQSLTMATLTATWTGESGRPMSTPPPSPTLQPVTALYDRESNPGAEGAPCYTPCPNDGYLRMHVQPTHLRTGSAYEWTMEMEKTVTRPYEYLSSQPGKDIRKQLLTACNFWLNIDETALKTIGSSVSMLHNASLLIDDIQDGSDLRRGQPSAHTIFGVAQTINSANHAYFLAQKELLGLREGSSMVKIFNEELINLHRGQGMDIHWRETVTTPTEQEYLLMISNKTGGLFRLAIRLMQAVSSVSVDLVPLIDLLGLIFQIQDDYLNLTSQPMASAKGYCDDLEEGKFSFPVIHAIRNDPSEQGWMLNTLRNRPTDEHTKRQAVEYMTNVTQSLEYTRATIEWLMGRMRATLTELGPRNAAFEAVLDKIVA
ncbi:geranylgeranyl pyrophosphate synthetase [Xanthoria calcicola]